MGFSFSQMVGNQVVGAWISGTLGKATRWHVNIVSLFSHVARKREIRLDIRQIWLLICHLAWVSMVRGEENDLN